MTTSNYDILVTLSTFAEYSDEPLHLLENSGLSFRVNQSGKRMTPAEVVSQGQQCLGLVAGVEKYAAETLGKLPNLKSISRVGVGIDSIDLEECERRGVAVLNTPEEPVLAVAELTLAMMLGLMRQLPRVTTLTREKRWQRVPGNLLSGKTVGLIGLGRIGQKVAGMLQAFNARVISTDPFPPLEWTQKHTVEMVSFETLLARSDIVSIHASAGETTLSIGRNEIEMMKPGAWLVNMARGDMVDDVALAEALESKRIRGAGLDVFPQEPYTGPLCSSDRVILTPHQATLNYETRVDMETHAVKNIVEYLHKTK